MEMDYRDERTGGEGENKREDENEKNGRRRLAPTGLAAS